MRHSTTVEAAALPRAIDMAAAARTGRGRWLLVLASAVVLSGCLQPPTKRDAKLARDLAHMQYAQEPLIINDADGYTYTNAPQETWLGPHRFMIPANYFTDQAGPDFQGGVTMEVEWPDLKPLPPGRRRVMSMPEFFALVGGGINYVDRLPWQESMENGVSPPLSTSLRRRDPVRNLAYRTRGQDVHGLQRWYVSDRDKQLFRDIVKGQEYFQYWPPRPEDIEDWYLRWDAQGQLVTRIKCTPLIQPDGLVLQDGRVVDVPEVRRSALCRHSFAIPKYKALVSLGYARVLLGEWQRIEQTYRQNLDRYYVGEGEGWKKKREERGGEQKR
ncbi:hypothetical protein [Variovorax sp.]|uniref:hypothetical protein n=1 Tax=Variovorax sp. TaxID=1871043 RepID=UPI002D424454|nr:hypothetical protein [Variovorax sp.]HYP83740.1 hypothetical protein [Variovorax sp.]